MKKAKLNELKSYIEELKIIKKELLQEDNGFLNIESFRCTLNNGKSMKREKILKGGLNKSACIVMPILDDAKTILVVQPRLSTSEGVSVELPAGYVEQNEKPVTAALRELREETGYFPNKMVYLDKFYQDQACGVASYNYGFVALNCKKKFNQELDESEYLKYFECDLDDAYELTQLGYINDIQSKYVMMCAKKYLKK